MKNKGKTINSEGCPKGKAWGTSRGIDCLSWVFYIRMLFSLKSQGHEFIVLSSRVRDWRTRIYCLVLKTFFTDKNLLSYPWDFQENIIFLCGKWRNLLSLLSFPHKNVILFKVSTTRICILVLETFILLSSRLSFISSRVSFFSLRVSFLSSRLSRVWLFFC